MEDVKCQKQFLVICVAANSSFVHITNVHMSLEGN